MDLHKDTHTAVMVNCWNEKLDVIVIENKPSEFNKLAKRVNKMAVKLGLPLDAEAILIIEVDGPQILLDRQAQEIAKLCQDCGAREIKIAETEEERESIWAARRSVSAAVVQIKPTKISEDISVPRMAIPRMVRRLKEIASRYNLELVIFGHAGDGNLHPNILCDQTDAEEMQRVEKVKAMEGNNGFNALTEKYEDLYDAGIVDPAKVTRSALQNAASIAAMLLSTECLIADKPEDEEEGKAKPRM
jgi:FAD/FMN-containing dehydrogenase